MNILLVYPINPTVIGQFKHMVKVAGRKSAYPPLGLLTVASLLPKEWNKKLVDMNVKALTESDVNWADYVFISATNVHEGSVRELLKYLGDKSPKVVAGGPLFTHDYHKYENVDYYILNEAEITLPQFLDDLKKGEAKHLYKSDQFADVTKTPLASWELLNFDDYLYGVVQYSRGCPYLCDFCDVTALFGRRPRTKTPEQIIKELDRMISLGNSEQIFFADDNLMGNKNLLKKELLPALIEWRKENPYAPGFATQITINLADDKELAELMLEAGFRFILIGIESIDENTLNAMKKKQNTGRNILEDVNYLQSLGFTVIGTFIVGLDNDSLSVFDNLINFIQKSGIIITVINILKAPPGTELHERMKRENRLLENFEFDEHASNVIPKMGVDNLKVGYQKVINNVYSPENVYNRIQHFFSLEKKYKVKYPLDRKVRIKDVKRALNIMFVLGIIDANRKYFWKLFFQTLKRNYRSIDMVFLFSLLMYQYNFLRKEKIDETNRMAYT